MTCAATAPLSCWLERIATALEGVDPITDYVLPIASLVVTLFVGLAAAYLGWATYRVSMESTALSLRSTELAERAERSIYGEAVQAYYESRREDIYNGTNWNMPHYTDEVEAAGARVGAPNADLLLGWLTASIDRLLGDDAPEHDRHINSFHFRATVPVVISEWVHDPTNFAHEPFRLWHERRGTSTTTEVATD